MAHANAVVLPCKSRKLRSFQGLSGEGNDAGAKRSTIGAAEGGTTVLRLKKTFGKKWSFKWGLTGKISEEKQTEGEGLMQCHHSRPIR